MRSLIYRDVGFLISESIRHSDFRWHVAVSSHQAGGGIGYISRHLQPSALAAASFQLFKHKPHVLARARAAGAQREEARFTVQFVRDNITLCVENPPPRQLKC